MSETELNPSKLGTLEYWEEAYEKEIENFNDHGDEGEIWFGTQSAKRVVNWIKSKNIEKNSKIIDIGCGNGFSCCLLAEAGFTDVLGVDYSAKAVELSESIRDDKDLDIKYEVMDVLDLESIKIENYDIAIDKGTYDAIALSADNPKEKRLTYKKFLCKILRNDSLFIITSCNWTIKELVDFFTQDKEFEFLEELKSQANFSFGGGTGSATSTAVFKYHKI